MEDVKVEKVNLKAYAIKSFGCRRGRKVNKLFKYALQLYSIDKDFGEYAIVALYETFCRNKNVKEEVK